MVFKKGFKHSQDAKDKIKKSRIGKMEGDKNIAKRPDVKAKIVKHKTWLKNGLKTRFKKGHLKGIKPKNLESIQKNRIGTKHSEKTKLKMKIARSRQITPIKDTKIEIKIQNFLKELKIGFFPHFFINEIKHSYQCDIFIPIQKSKDKLISQPIILECDGNYWHKYPNGREIDHIRTCELSKIGFRIIRLWEYEIKSMTLEEFKSKLNLFILNKDEVKNNGN